MKKSLIAVAVLVLIGIGAYYYLSINEDKTLVGATTTYSNADVGVAFDYPAGPEGYILQELTSADPATGLVRSVVLIHADDYASVVNPPVGGEGPPVIALNVFTNSKNQFPLVWAEENIAYSSINLKQGETAEAVVGGANAIRYNADGLYASDNVVVAHGGFVYVFTGQYLDANSDLKRDFGPIVESVRFIPAPGQE